MKNLIFLFLLIFSACQIPAQTIDTTNWSLTSTDFSGKFTAVKNRTTYQGKAAGSVTVSLSLDIASIDTSAWSFVIPGFDGIYRQAKNRNVFYGKAPGTVIINLVYNTISSSGGSTNLYHYSHLDSANTRTANLSFSGTAQLKPTFGTVTIASGGSGTSNKQMTVITYTTSGNLWNNTGENFTLNNNLIAATSGIVVSMVSPNFANNPSAGFPTSIFIISQATGTCNIALWNSSAINESSPETITITVTVFNP